MSSSISTRIYHHCISSFPCSLTPFSSMLLLLTLLLFYHIPSINGIACFTDIACLMLPNGDFACNNTALVDCTESQACFTYYSAPDLTQSPSSWLSSTWTRRLRGCASDDVVTSLFDTATGWSARCGFGGERLVEEMRVIMRDTTNQTTETATIPILAGNDSVIAATLNNGTIEPDNTTLPVSFPIPDPLFNDTIFQNELNFTTPMENITLFPTTDFANFLTNETLDNSTALPIETTTLTPITQSSTPPTPSTTTDPDATTETTESSTTSETDPGVAIGAVTESARRVRRDAMVPAGYAGCLCYSDGCNGPEDKYLEEIRQWLQKRAAEAQGRRDGVELKTTDYEDTGAEPISESG